MAPTKPSAAQQKAESILDSPSQQFSPDSLPALTAYLDEQMADAASYSLRSNVGILKLFTLFPNLTDANVIQKILIQSLTQLPANDFNICLAQLSLPVQDQPPIAQLVGLHNMLQTCLFSKFWEAAQKPVSYNAKLPVIQVPGLRESVRNFVLDVVPLVYLQISVPEMRSLLNFDANCEEFEKLLESKKWTLEGGYKRKDKQAGICVPSTREEVLKQQKGPAQPNSVEKYFKPESMRHYHGTMRSSAS